ncbi:MAG: DUF58 domain-containing protein [Methanobacteriota archaeon]
MEFISIDELRTEVDVNVQRLEDIFRFGFNYRVILHGSGLEFSQLREYVPGEDDPRRIDWKSSLRSDHLYVKDYEEERNLDVFILLDTSASMLFGTQDKLKSEYAAVLASTLAHAATEAGDNVGFCMFNDNVLNYHPPSKDSSIYYQMLNYIVNPAYYGGGCNLKKALMHLINIIDAKTALFIISDFIGIGDDWHSPMKTLSAKLDSVFGIMVRDVRDSFIPEHIGNTRVSDPFTGKSMIVNMDAVRRDFEKAASEQERAILDEFHSSRARFVKVYTDQNFIEPLIKYLELGT